MPHLQMLHIQGGSGLYKKVYECSLTKSGKHPRRLIHGFPRGSYRSDSCLHEDFHDYKPNRTLFSHLLRWAFGGDGLSSLKYFAIGDFSGFCRFEHTELLFARDGGFPID